MKKVSIIIVVLLSIFFIGCKERHCPKFPKELNYFPYAKKQELKFTNSIHDVSSFIISEKENTKAYYLGIYDKGDCDCSSRFSTNRNQDYMNISGNFSIAGNKYEDGSVSIYFDFDNYINKDNFSIILINNRDFPIKELSKYINDTIVMENEKNKMIKKIIIVKGKGLISYTTVDGEEWSLIK